MSLLCVGSVAYDVIELPGRPPVEVLGGSATWFCTAAGLLARPQLVAVVGDDFSEDDIHFLRQRGVDTAGLARKPGTTFRWHGRYHANLISRDSLKTELGVFADFSPVIPEDWRSPDVLFLGNIKPDLQGLVLAQAREARFVGLDTIECWISDFRDELVRLMPRVDLLFVNDDEVRQLSGELNVLKAAQRVLEMGAKAIVVKRGEHGAILVSPDGMALLPAYPLEAVIDPTGAGDCFAGATLAYLDNVQDFGPAAIRRALAVGTVMGSFCVQGFGPRSLTDIHMSDLRTRVRNYVDLVALDRDCLLSGLEIW